MSSSQAGLSMANIQAAKQCLRVVGSVDERLGDSFGAKFMEFTPDTSIESPEEILGRWCMVKEIHDLLKTLDLTERQVLVLRFGLGGHHLKSLQEIGTCFRSLALIISLSIQRRPERNRHVFDYLADVEYELVDTP
ncbi:hypothetical protein Vadar_008881 [Vaccinium darrowii]|uniref:Uncharacterized protein n=1 Tax=Vaccinium darrowii TaxID=229202 RepID=A0ACB7XPL2_9ERIC|nr:hypothetical protein Vadar_008881 [Vaccinium darrowii]